jgi:tRNA pseudouridine38-40 synthase
MVRRLKLIIAYDGAPFAGWQSQKHHNTIQDHLEHAFERVSGTPVRVHGAGRTDAGVHALAQCAHVDLATGRVRSTGGLEDGRLSPARWTGALNALLPPTIRVLRCRYVSKQFHARFSAKGKVYRYRIWVAPVLSPLEYKRAWHVPAPLDFALLKAAAGKFAGTHDFVGFAANRGKRETDTTRTIRSVRVRRNGACVTIDIDGDGFLYKMVRLMVGSLVECALGKSSVKQIAHRLDSGRGGSTRFAAPAEGLFLIRVRY